MLDWENFKLLFTSTPSRYYIQNAAAHGRSGCNLFCSIVAVDQYILGLPNPTVCARYVKESPRSPEKGLAVSRAALVLPAPCYVTPIE